ncbi:hypothetical protein INT47_004687 [Mucor saturninus]|uniref:Uncharacterized protein n=1 Tax=Mucor saturninus TaxID=64648 RepID=A0A8H7QI79_9FUNG|nr:hypothetical protein INT47_004687 [Mucor saturninus]
MDWEEEVNPYNAETLSNFTQYSEKQPTDFDMTDPELPERMAQHNLQLKFLCAAASARKAAINVRTGHDWAKRLKNDPDFDIFEKNTSKTVRKVSQLQEEHKAHLIEFFDDNPHARVSDAVEELTKNFEGFTLRETVVGKFISTECNLSIKKITRHPVARNQNAKIKERRE